MDQSPFHSAQQLDLNHICFVLIQSISYLISPISFPLILSLFLSLSLVPYPFPSRQTNDLKKSLAESLTLPLRQIEHYTKILEALLNEFKEKDFITEEFKTVANLEIEIKKLCKLMLENYNVNSIKGSLVCLFMKYTGNSI